MYYLVKLALRNVFRNKRRSILTGISIAFAVAIVIFMYSFIQGELKMIFDLYMRIQSGHVRVLNPEYARREKMMPLQHNIADYNSVREKILSIPGVTDVSGRIKFGVLIDYKGSTKQTFGMGVDPQLENKIIDFGKKIEQGRMINQKDDEANIGIVMSKELGFKLGDTLTVVTQTAYGSIYAKNFKIVGIYNFGSPIIDRKTFFVPIPAAQDLLDMYGAVSEIFVMTDNPDKAVQTAEKIRGKLGPGYAVKPWQEQGPLYSWFKIGEYMYLAIYCIILLLSGFTILNTMFMAVLERTREIGMMKALGMKNRQLIAVIMFEAIVLGSIASGIGTILGGAGSYYFSTVGMDISTEAANIDFPMPYVIYGDFSWYYLVFGFTMGLIFTLLASILPALRAAKLEPREALHEI